MNTDQNHTILPWIMAHAAGQITRRQTGLDGRAPHERWRGRRLEKKLPPFGETVLYLPAGKVPIRLHGKWRDGIFLRVVERSSELYDGTELGLVLARSTKSSECHDSPCQAFQTPPAVPL